MLNCALLFSEAAAAKGKVQRKSKARRKREEKKRRAKGKLQGEQPRDALMDNEDSSSTTTETSNPDVDLGLKEVRAPNASVRSAL